MPPIRFIDSVCKIPDKGPFLGHNGGKIFTRTLVTCGHEGKSHDLNVIVKFKDYEQAKAMMGTSEWNELQEHRRTHSDYESATPIFVQR